MICNFIVGVCMDEDLIYVIGGWIDQRGTKYCDTYDLRTNKWEHMASLHTGKYQG